MVNASRRYYDVLVYKYLCWWTVLQADCCPNRTTTSDTAKTSLKRCLNKYFDWYGAARLCLRRQHRTDCVSRRPVLNLDRFPTKRSYVFVDEHVTVERSSWRLWKKTWLSFDYYSYYIAVLFQISRGYVRPHDDYGDSRCVMEGWWWSWRKKLHQLKKGGLLPWTESSV